MNSIILEDIKNICKDEIFNCCKGKTFLITGANGFLPSYMVYTLLYLNEKFFSDKCKIIALVRNKIKAIEKFKNYLDRKDFELLVQDVCDPIHITDKVDYIIHAASQASPKYYFVDPVGTLKPNIIGTYNLLELAREKKPESFLFFSSSEVYGNTNNISIDEKTYGYLSPLEIRSCYAESKRMAETMCLSYLHQYNIPVKFVRPFHTYGPGMLLDDGRVFADFVNNIICNNDIILKSDGNAVRTFCYLSDATLAFFIVLFRGNKGEAYNVSNENCSISIKELAYLLTKIFNERNLSVDIKDSKQSNYIKSNIYKSIPNIDKIKSLNWNAKINLETGFKRTVKSFEIDNI